MFLVFFLHFVANGQEKIPLDIKSELIDSAYLIFDVKCKPNTPFTGNYIKVFVSPDKLVNHFKSEYQTALQNNQLIPTFINCVRYRYRNPKYVVDNIRFSLDRDNCVVKKNQNKPKSKQFTRSKGFEMCSANMFYVYSNGHVNADREFCNFLGQCSPDGFKSIIQFQLRSFIKYDIPPGKVPASQSKLGISFFNDFLCASMSGCDPIGGWSGSVSNKVLDFKIDFSQFGQQPLLDIIYFKEVKNALIEESSGRQLIIYIGFDYTD